MTPALTARMRHGFAAALFILFAIGVNHSMAGEKTAPAARKAHKVVLQVSDGDPKKWNLTLINAKNVQTEQGKDNVVIEIVAYGPAIDMLRIESEVEPRVNEAIKSGIKVVACENTMHGLRLTAADMLPHIHYTRTGVVYLMEKQEQGYAYIRP
ncbi:MAG: DsrE family protein [Sulfurimicrobium sp.]|nr:DsrE family protein [Sulfurimicrobium sp.]